MFRWSDSLKKPLAFAFVALTLIAAPAAAEDWYRLANTSEVIGFGDADSLHMDGEIASARVMLGLREPMGSEGNIEFLVSSVRFSCSQPSYFIEEVTGLDADKATVAELPGSQEWRSISEGSMNADFREFACGTAQNTTSADPFADADRFWQGDRNTLESHAYEMAGDFDVG
jgi:hypothetical protein